MPTLESLQVSAVFVSTQLVCVLCRLVHLILSKLSAQKSYKTRSLQFPFYIYLHPMNHFHAYYTSLPSLEC